MVRESVDRCCSDRDEFQGLLQHLWLFKPMEVMQMPGPRLSPDDRALIQAGVESGLSIRAIGGELGRAPVDVLEGGQAQPLAQGLSL